MEDTSSFSELLKKLTTGSKHTRETVSQLAASYNPKAGLTFSDVAALLELNTQLCPGNRSEEWNSFFINTVTNYVLSRDRRQNVLSDETATWMMCHLPSPECTDEYTLKLLVVLMTRAVYTPDCFRLHVLNCLRYYLQNESIPLCERLKLVESAFLAGGGDGRAAITKQEMSVLLNLPEQTLSQGTDQLRDYAASVIARCVVHDASTPNRVDESEETWIVNSVAQPCSHSNENSSLSNPLRARVPEAHLARSSPNRNTRYLYRGRLLHIWWVGARSYIETVLEQAAADREFWVQIKVFDDDMDAVMRLQYCPGIIAFPDLVFVELTPNTLTAFGLLWNIQTRKQIGDVPVYIMTDDLQAKSIQRLRNRGAAGILNFPVTWKDVRELLELNPSALV